MAAPNIFDYAPSELSQDAVLAYILAWAHPQFQVAHPELNALGDLFLRTLLDSTSAPGSSLRPSAAIGEIRQLAVTTQDHRFDVCVLVNETLRLIIEDKTNTKEHSAQIKRYRALSGELFKDKGVTESTTLVVYVKTGNESLSSKPKSADGWLSRIDILKVLREFTSTGNGIIDEFRLYLEGWEDKTEDYSCTTPSKWSHLAHQGFFLRLEREAWSGSNWAHASNPSGGSFVFWFHSGHSELHACTLYLQIDHRAGLFLRVSGGDEKKISVSKLRSILTAAKAAAGSIHSDVIVSKPKRLRSGSTANAARLVFDDSAGDEGTSYIATEGGVIDIDRTLARLRTACELLDVMRAMPAKTE